MEQSRVTVVFRADGSADIGMGHFVRTLALASMLPADKFHRVFATCCPSQAMRDQVSFVCDELWELDSATHFDDFFVRLSPNYTVVLDNYFFDTHYQQRIVDLGCRLFCVDDMREKHYVSHVVVNHAPGFSRDDFSMESYSELCAGLDWAMLRSEFTDHKLRVAVCFGGVDKYNLAQRVKDRLSFCDVHIIRGMSAAEVAREYRAADVAVVSASTAMLEALAVGIPVIAGYYVDNQKDIYSRAHTSELVAGVGDWLDQGSLDLLDRHIDRLIGSRPGSGAKARYEELFSRRISVRNVESGDCRQLFQWANDPTTRAVSFNTEPISWPVHCMWFDRKISDPNCFFYIAFHRDKAVGQVRVDFDPTTNQAVLGISLDSSARGCGFGSEMLTACVGRFFDQCPACDVVNAYVKEDNVASARMFLRVGFAKQSTTDGVIHFTLKSR